jgi:hypothetical protein
VPNPDDAERGTKAQIRAFAARSEMFSRDAAASRGRKFERVKSCLIR